MAELRGCPECEAPFGVDIVQFGKPYSCGRCGVTFVAARLVPQKLVDDYATPHFILDNRIDTTNVLPMRPLPAVPDRLPLESSVVVTDKPITAGAFTHQPDKMPGPSPVPMLLWCPAGHRHIDEGVYAEKPHHTHACQHCGIIWRPTLVDTVGVQFLPGFKNV